MSHGEQKEMLLKNMATQETLYWDAVSEDDLNFYLHGYITEKYGVWSNYNVLPKFLWKDVKDAG